ncbi:hypothetical protein DDZ15_06870 [Rhodohalobacter mucosus]|uniref:WD40 repeat protein n=2 Tax=Rhodohalobacter mucosus TaxID=2079485 RepID=A0A316TRD4_9BACT|nr:hypothetical protein DDZ15_06870 [Rhodohalobacter mucosus]
MLCGAAGEADAQTSPALLDYPQNHLPWFTIESEHFLVHYQEGSEAGAVSVLNAAEKVYDPITGLYQFEPDGKLSIVIRDREDYSNGAAFFFDNKIEIWLPALDTPFRGTHSWIENVVAHELTHMIQLGVSMKRSRHLPAIYFQWLSYENVRRPDVLYGFPNGLITLPSSATSVPAWFAEGTAQYIRQSISHDSWDSHRDMLLRTRILDGSELGLTEMAVFSSKNSLERELVYNQGYSFVKYLTETFGDRIVAEISRESSSAGLNNFHNAIENTTGIQAGNLYRDWLNRKRSEYRKQLQGMTLTEPDIVENDGFLNFYPQFSGVDGRLAYLTNRGRDFSRTALVLRDGDRLIYVDDSGDPDNEESTSTPPARHGVASPFSIDYIGNRFSFSPDGERIVYSRAEKNRFGEQYQDLYLFNIENESTRQITFDQRIQDPVWHPEGNRIAAVKQSAGTQNLVLLNTDGSEIRTLTRYSDFETVYTPVWHPDGSTIYFSAADEGSKNLFRIREPFDRAEPVLVNEEIDIRDPWVDADGEYLYFSADINGIFNIYRLNLADATSEQLTNVPGGAFMPHVYNNTLYFSGYRSNGYNISSLPLRNSVPADTDDLLPRVRTGQKLFTASNRAATDEPTAVPVIDKRPYEQTTTGLSVFPVVRFDNYTKLKGSNRTLLTEGEFGRLGENLARDIKLGVYLSSRDVTERLSLFAGALIGPGSIPADGVSGFFSPNRINNLDRDLFLIAEHRGLPFIRRSWSPTISLELYNLKRNVRDGLLIEEFPCTSCLPAERGIDIRYSVWEASLWFKSKLNRWSVAELGVTYSPYSVQTDGFFSNEFNEFIPGSTSEYFRATTYTASYTASLFEPYRHSDIAPKGLGGTVAYRLQPGNLLSNFELDDGILSPVYEKTVNQSVELKGRYGFGISGLTTALIQGRAFTYLNSPSDFFYLDYTGGLAGMRSYPYFAIGGQTTAFLTGSLIFPLRTGIFAQAGANTIDKVFLRLFAESGNGWGGPLNIGNRLKSGAGGELRVAFNRNYIFPMKLFINGSYGFDRFEIEFPSEFISTDTGNRSQYGGEFLFYIGLTFDFDSL